MSDYERGFRDGIEAAVKQAKHDAENCGTHDARLAVLSASERIRRLTPPERGAAAAATCAESGTPFRTMDGWHEGTETCGACGQEVRVRDNGTVAKHATPQECER